MKTLIYLSPVLLAISLSACNNSSNNGTATTGTAVNAIAAKSADSEPASIGNASALQQDLNALFGDADGEPVEIQDSESLSGLLSRLNP